jgi:hypothetical protein
MLQAATNAASKVVRHIAGSVICLTPGSCAVVGIAPVHISVAGFEFGYSMGLRQRRAAKNGLSGCAEPNALAATALRQVRER